MRIWVWTIPLSWKHTIMNEIIIKPVTLSGRYFSKKDIIHIQETIRLFPKLSLTELAQTLCENLNWMTARRSNKINSCLSALEKLDSMSYIKLPKKRQQKKRQSKKIEHSEQTDPGTEIVRELGEISDIELILVNDKIDTKLWNEYVDRYHYLGYKHPIGSALKYFIVANITHQKTILGCLLFSSAVWHLADRDQWINWEKKDREQRLNLVINNTRFLIFPWIKIHNLASKALSMITRQIQNDWQAVHAYRPVLIETFVDDNRYSGACYKSANWQQIGHTSGKNWQDSTVDDTSSTKSIFVFPLQSNFRAILKNQKPENEPINTDEKFVSLWGKVVHIISDVAQTFDLTWQKRRRVIDSLLLIFLIFRLVFSKNSQGYSTTLAEYWINCHREKFTLPQKKPISASSFSDARKKLDENIFKILNQRIIEAYSHTNEHQHLWFGHNLYAVDGCKINLPRPLSKYDYKKPSDNANYPQGLLSCIYQLKSKIPHDFDLVSHGNERQCALAHLKNIAENDVIVYDRGYFSYAMLYHHLQSNIHPIFRLQRNSFCVIEEFWKSESIDKIVTLLPSKDLRREIIKKDPSIIIKPLNIRLVKYTVVDNVYCIGTTLMDKQYTPNDFKDVYHERWGIEELYKVSKQMISVDDFHGKSERTVKQELFAHFVLITMSRLCANESENILSTLLDSVDKKDKPQTIKVNFKNCLTVVSRQMEKILLVPSRCIKTVMDEIIDSISHCRQKVRPNRSYDRISMKPINKWRACSATK